jgi:hypothetical protein
VNQLQLQLAEMESLFKQERKAHANQLQSQREDYEERMQALQLRLYISETRSRTFEDALHEHIKAVANNVALTPIKSSGEEESTATSISKLLYSRVAKNKE